MPVATPARALRVVRGGAPGSSWELTFSPPHPALAGYVHDYCGYHERTPDPARRRELPGAQVVLIIDFGPTLRLLDPQGRTVAAQHAGGFVAGLDDGYTLTETAGRMEGIQVNFTPLGARRFLQRPMQELARRTVGIDDLLGRAGREMTDRLHGARTWTMRFQLLDDLILEQMRRAVAPPAWVPLVYDRIVACAGNLDIAALARQVGYSRKHVASAFREHVGMPPKAVAGLVRFGQALEALRAGGRSDLATLAQDLGYYDQAHFTREFRAYAGLPPGEFLHQRSSATLGVPG